jgi:hypothetical protein
MAMTADLRKPPRDPELDDLPPCKNCGEPFELHMQDGEPLYMCPYEHQMQPTYGFFHGGDPREFHPDYESCTEHEIAAWKQARAEAEANESKRSLPCESGWIAPGVHVLKSSFGIGIVTYPPTCYERA